MRICDKRVWSALLLLLASMPLWSARPSPNPYGEVSLPMQLHKVADAPVYYLFGLSGVPGAENEGHTSNAGFVVTDGGVVVFDALGTPALGYRMLQHIRAVTDQPIERIIVSHYHADHIYGLQAFKEHAGNPEMIAQSLALGYIGGARHTQGEAAQSRLEQRREALYPWVDEKTYVVAPVTTFEKDYMFTLGGLSFEVRHLGPAHAPGDSIMLVRELGVLFGGDVIYKGRVPFLDSPETDVRHWIEGLDYLASLNPPPSFIIPGHGEADDSVTHSLSLTREYLQFVIDAMTKALQQGLTFEQAYQQTDWSKYKDLPAFKASNRGNAYRIYLELEPEMF